VLTFGKSQTILHEKKGAVKMSQKIQGPLRAFVVNNRTYWFHSLLTVIPTQMLGQTFISCENTRMGPGYLGAAVQFYDHNCHVVQESYGYNADTVSEFVYPMVRETHVGESYYVGGWGIAWNEISEQYVTDPCGASIAGWGQAEIAIPKPKTNLAGQTYGVGYGAGALENWPDLVAAVNKDGQQGYIKYKEHMLSSMPKSPKAAAKLMKEHRVPATLDLYDCEGNPIGKFDIA
jgi:hypothetical protein